MEGRGRSRTHIVVPCFNEGHRLAPEPFLAFLEEEPDTDFCFVDDGSTDDTWERLSSMASESHDRITALRMEENAGKSEAVRRGVLAALESPAVEHVGYWDADLSTPVAEIPRFVEVLDTDPHCRAVFGSRVRLLGRSIERRASRHYFGRVFATVVSTALDMPVYDTQCGAKLFRVTPGLQELFRDPFSSRWVFDVEIVARMIVQADRGGGPAAAEVIYELPLREWHHVEGSKVRPHDFVLGIWDVGRIYRRYLAGRRKKSARGPLG